MIIKLVRVTRFTPLPIHDAEYHNGSPWHHIHRNQIIAVMNEFNLNYVAGYVAGYDGAVFVTEFHARLDRDEDLAIVRMHFPEVRFLPDSEGMTIEQYALGSASLSGLLSSIRKVTGAK